MLYRKQPTPSERPQPAAGYSACDSLATWAAGAHPFRPDHKTASSAPGCNKSRALRTPCTTCTVCTGEEVISKTAIQRQSKSGDHGQGGKQTSFLGGNHVRPRLSRVCFLHSSALSNKERKGLDDESSRCKCNSSAISDKSGKRLELRTDCINQILQNRIGKRPRPSSGKETVVHVPTASSGQHLGRGLCVSGTLPAYSHPCAQQTARATPLERALET